MERLAEWIVVFCFVLYAAVTGQVTRWEVNWLLDRYRNNRPPWNIFSERRNR